LEIEKKWFIGIKISAKSGGLQCLDRKQEFISGKLLRV